MKSECLTKNEKMTLAEAKLGHLNGVLRAATSINRLMLKEKDIKKLIQDSCDVLISTGGYRHAWIALVNKCGEVFRVAQAGMSNKSLPFNYQLRQAHWPDCMGKALAQPGVVITESPLVHCVDCLLVGKCVDGETMTICIASDGGSYTLLSTSSPNTVAVDNDQLSIFTEIAGDIAFSLQNIEAEKVRKAEIEKLKESESRLRFAFDSLGEGVIISDKQGRVTDLNSATLQLYSCDQKQTIIGQSALNVVPSRDHTKAVKRMSQTLESEQGEEFECKLMAKDRKGEYDASIHFSLLRNTEGKSSGFIAIMRDITERKRAHGALREAEEQHRALLDTGSKAGEGIAILQDTDNQEATIVFANDEWARILGYGCKEEILGLRSIDMVEPRFRPKHLEEYRKRIKGELVPTRFEIAIIRKDGTTLPVELGLGITTFRGKTASVVYGRDISERKKSEVELKESVERFRSVAQSASDAIMIINTQGNIIFWNHAAETVLGYSSSEAVGSPLSTVVPERYRERLSKHIERLVVKKIPDPPGKAVEVYATKKDGSEFPAEASLAAWQTREGFFVTIILRDCTEHKRLRENLQYYITGITKAHEEERRRIARELHDDTAQSLALLCLEIQAPIKENKYLSEEVLQRLEELRTRTSNILAGVRRLCHNLRPELLDQMGLMPALELLTCEMNEISCLNVSIKVTGVLRHLPHDVEMEIFRITQEALRNVERHSRATKATVEVAFNLDTIRFCIADNGVGFDRPVVIGDLASRGKLGLIGMQERARLLGGNLCIETEVGKGTEVMLEFRG